MGHVVTFQGDEALAGQVGFLDHVDAVLTINGIRQLVQIDPRTTLLDLLREQLQKAATAESAAPARCIWTGDG
jgi:hypothetical protein